MKKSPLKTQPITLIAAMGLDRTIGLNNDMPWHLPEDLQHFKARTLGKTLIMGKNTFDSIGKPLPGRTTIILSRSLKPEDINYPKCYVASSFEKALELAKELSEEQEIIIAGGGQIYQIALSFATHLVITEIAKAFAGDTFFPEWDPRNWTLATEEQHQQTQTPFQKYRFLEYHRKVQG